MRTRALAIAFAVLLVLLVAAAVGGRLLVESKPWHHPDAWKLFHSWNGDWNAPFVSQTEDADGLRIRDSDSTVPVYFETEDAEVARRFLDLVRIDATRSGYGCGCCTGDVVIEVLTGGDVGVSFNLLGYSLQSGRVWPGDAALTMESADAVCEWLTARGVGVKSPLESMKRSQARSEARQAAREAFLGPERFRALGACEDVASIAALLAEWEPDLADRIVFAVRLLAVDRTEVDDAHDLGWRMRLWLWDAHDFPAVAEAFDRLLADDVIAPTVAAQSVRIHGEDGRELAWLVLAGLRIRWARRLLESPDEDDRVAGVDLLGEFDFGSLPETDTMLLGVVLSAGDGARPASPPTESQKAAASLLVRFCDPPVFPCLQALADASEDRRWAGEITGRIAARRRGNSR